MAVRLSGLSACWTIILIAKVNADLSTPVYEKIVRHGNTARISCASHNNSGTLELVDAVYEGIGTHCTDYSVKDTFEKGCDGQTGCIVWTADPSSLQGCKSRPLKVRYTCTMTTESKERAPPETEQTQEVWKFALQQQQAVKTCEEHVMNQPYPNDGRLYCNRTFDGWGCWNDTLAGTQAHIPCPTWVNDGFASHLKAFKDCNDDGAWWIHPSTSRTWSNYTQCIDQRRLVQSGEFDSSKKLDKSEIL